MLLLRLHAEASHRTRQTQRPEDASVVGVCGVELLLGIMVLPDFVFASAQCEAHAGRGFQLARHPVARAGNLNGGSQALDVCVVARRRLACDRDDDDGDECCRRRRSGNFDSFLSDGAA